MNSNATTVAAAALALSDQSEVYISATAIASVLIICLVLDAVIKRYRLLWMPESVAAMLAGMVLGGFVLAPGSDRAVKTLAFSPDFFFTILLPPIILEAGYSLSPKIFLMNMRVSALIFEFNQLKMKCIL